MQVSREGHSKQKNQYIQKAQRKSTWLRLKHTDQKGERDSKWSKGKHGARSCSGWYIIKRTFNFNFNDTLLKESFNFKMTS